MKRFRKCFITSFIFALSLSLTSCGSESVETLVEAEEPSESVVELEVVTETEETASEVAGKKENDALADNDTIDDESDESETAVMDMENSEAVETETIETEIEKEVLAKEDAKKEEKPKEEKPAAAVHKHDYKGTVTANATCTNAGTKTFTCSCGDSYTEAIGQTAHDFSVPIVDTIWHDEIWSTVPREVTTKWTHCHTCDGNFYSTEEFKNHFSYCDKWTSYDVFEKTQTVYDQVKVSDGYFEEAIVGYKCSVCGQQQ